MAAYFLIQFSNWPLSPGSVQGTLLGAGDKHPQGPHNLEGANRPTKKSWEVAGKSDKSIWSKVGAQVKFTSTANNSRISNTLECTIICTRHHVKHFCTYSHWSLTLYSACYNHAHFIDKTMRLKQVK